MRKNLRVLLLSAEREILPSCESASGACGAGHKRAVTPYPAGLVTVLSRQIEPKISGGKALKFRTYRKFVSLAICSKLSGV